MTAAVHPRPGGHALVEQLVAHGVERTFGVPGESYLAVLDGLHEHRDRIDYVVTRQEGGAALMAAAHGRLTGRPGVCLVTRGPGATNASIGVHVASQDASPMVLFVGQVPRAERGRRAFQEIDYSAMFGEVAKAVVEIDLPDRVTELTHRALTLATAGEPGPVVVVLPEDVVTAPTAVPPRPVPPPAAAGPRVSELDAAARLIREATRPVVVAGRCGWSAQTARTLRELAERADIPVVTGLRNQDVLDNASPAFAGTLGLRTTAGLADRLREADTVVLLGLRPDGLTADDLEPALGGPDAPRVVHVYPDADEIGVLFPADVAIVSTPGEFLDRLPDDLGGGPERRAWRTRMRDELEALRASGHGEETAAAYMSVLDAHVRADPVITGGAGNYTGWAQRHHEFRSFGSQLASTSGSMGYGIPAATAAALECPDREVVAFAGDGCFLMNGQELATIAMYGLDVLVVIVNNGRYGTIRDHQERVYPGRVSGTTLANPDFVALAEAYGAHAARVCSPDELAAALPTLQSLGGLRVVEIRTE